MTRRGLILSAAAIASGVVAGLTVLAMLPPTPGVTKANFDRIQIGMNHEEVEALFGSPSSFGFGGDSGTLEVWTKDGIPAAHISFDQDSRVTGMSWIGSTEPAWQRMLRWLGLSKT